RGLEDILRRLPAAAAWMIRSVRHLVTPPADDSSTKDRAKDERDEPDDDNWVHLYRDGNALVLRFAIMMTYSCRRPRGSTTEFGEQRGEIAAREGPLERLRRVDVVFLEAKKPLTDSTERTEVIRREDLALDDGEIDLNLIEPTGVD